MIKIEKSIVRDIRCENLILFIEFIFCLIMFTILEVNLCCNDFYFLKSEHFLIEMS